MIAIMLHPAWAEVLRDGEGPEAEVWRGMIVRGEAMFQTTLGGLVTIERFRVIEDDPAPPTPTSKRKAQAKDRAEWLQSLSKRQKRGK